MLIARDVVLGISEVAPSPMSIMSSGYPDNGRILKCASYPLLLDLATVEPVANEFSSTLGPRCQDGRVLSDWTETQISLVSNSENVIIDRTI